MTAQELRCPSCSASLAVENRFARTVVCGFCGQVSHIVPSGLSPAGTGASLAQFPSIFAVGKKGSVDGTHFSVMGRLRFQYEDGYWDEWYLSTDDGRQIWLQEDEGEFVAFEKSTLTSEVPPFDSIRVGSSISIGDRKIFISEKGEAVISGGEGQISFKFYPGEGFFYADGNSAGKVISIEFSKDEIALFIGEVFEAGAFRFED